MYPPLKVVKAGDINIAADLFYPPFDGGVRPPNCYPFRVEYGVAKNWEVGVAFAYQNQHNTDEANIKYVLPWTFAGTKIAIGGQYVRFAQYAGQTSRMTDDNLYLAATRELYVSKDLMLIGNVGVTADKLNNWVARETRALPAQWRVPWWSSPA